MKSSLRINFFNKNRNSFEYIFVLLIFLVLPLIWGGCAKEEAIIIPEETPQPDPLDENDLMDRVLRIDIQNMDVKLEYIPDEDVLIGESIIEFSMRPNQTIPLIHFDPAGSDTIETIILNGEELDFNDPSDVKMISFDETTQDGIELLRECGNDKINILSIKYRIGYSNGYKSFYSNVNDIYGVGNEVVFPSINCPSDLSIHRITFSVVSDRDYSFIGSGKVTEIESNNVRKWMLDTERAVASYTIMWMLVPEEDIDFEEREVDGIDVRIMTYKDSVSIDSAFEILESWLPELRANIGMFPMERGLDVFLTQRGGGMEYFGATITSLSALEHEVFHMYFGCSVVAKTYRDSWWDEAINMWYEYSASGSASPVNQNFSSNIVSGRTPVSVGFDDRAYGDGARVIESIAIEMGGRDAFIVFLNQLYSNYTFSPFNTFELVDYIFNYSGIDFEDKIVKWLYSGTRVFYSASGTDGRDYHKVDMTPPGEIVEKYNRR